MVSGKPNRWWQDYVVAVVVYLLTLAPCFLGTIQGLSLMQPKGDWFSPQQTDKNPNTFIAALGQWDGSWYVSIARNGYSYDTAQASSVNFYPAYPCFIACLTFIFPWFSPHLWGLVISHAFLIASFVLLQKYIRLNFPKCSQQISLYAILLLALYPSAFWFRMVYTESMFLFLMLLFFGAMRKEWKLRKIAIIAGLATATQSAGVASAFVFLLYLINNSKSWNWRYLKIAGYTLLSLWGLILYTVYQWLVFGEPLAFVKTDNPYLQFQADRMLPDIPVILNYQTWNGLLFLVAFIAIIVGVIKRWMTFYEIVLAILLLPTPYMTNGGMQYMAGQARCVLVIFPVFIVLGMLLSKSSRVLALGILLLSALLQFFFAAQQSCGGYFIL